MQLTWLIGCPIPPWQARRRVFGQRRPLIRHAADARALARCHLFVHNLTMGHEMGHILKCHDIVKTDFVRAENCYLYDSAGKRYIDFESGIWSTALGHNHPRVNQAIRSQLEQVIHLGTRYPNGLAEGAATDVLGVVGMEEGKCVFLSSGSEAVELAVKIAQRATGKPLCLTFSSSYLAAYGSAGTKDAAHWRLVDWSAAVMRT